MEDAAASATATLKRARQAHARGDLSGAEATYRSLIAADPANAEIVQLLGAVALQRRNYSEARRLFRMAIELAPGHALYCANLANTERLAQRLPVAAVLAHRAWRLNSRFPFNSFLLARISRDRGRLQEAVTWFRKGLALRADDIDARYELAQVLLDLNDVGALVEYEKVLNQNPHHAQALDRLAYAYRQGGLYVRSRAMLVRMLALQPQEPRVLQNLALVLRDGAQIEDALQTYDRALELAPGAASLRSDRLFTLHYSPRFHLAALREAAEAWGRHHPAAPAVHRRPRRGGAPLRVGLVSGDLRRHPVGYFCRQLFRHNDPAALSLIAYSTGPEADDMTAALRADAAAWHEIAATGDAEVAERIRADGIDILIDLAGHTGRNRLPMFQRRPAPMAMTWAGWCGTTGAAIDYLIADRWQVPEDLEWGYTERILRMPDGYVVYDPPDYAPPVSALPARSQGAVTFGCFNNLSKINADVVALWAQVLRAVPRSRLLLQTRALNELPIAERLTWQFALQGVGGAQLDLRPGLPHAELLASYGEVDIALDPFPYSGGLTTCEALWMGVPVLTLPGQTFAGRHSLSHLSNVGLIDWIARDGADYVSKAAGFAADLDSLAMLRAGLRERVAASPLADGPRFARNFATALRSAWDALED